MIHRFNIITIKISAGSFAENDKLNLTCVSRHAKCLRRANTVLKKKKKKNEDNEEWY